MERSIIIVTTLVDITATGVIRSGIGRDLERNQQRNYETVLQVLSLRTQPHIINRPHIMELDEFLVKILFGEMYSKPQLAWRFEFTADFTSAYATEDGPLGALIDDFKEVPVITGLTETARFMLPIFYTTGAIKNIHFMQLLEQ